jgi:uncharacterized membrane protein (UPF0182 family)
MQWYFLLFFTLGEDVVARNPFFIHKYAIFCHCCPLLEMVVNHIVIVGCIFEDNAVQ